MIAHDLGLKPTAVARLHKVYLLAVARVAMADNELTREELVDLQRVAELLSLGPTAVETRRQSAKSRLPAPRRRRLRPDSRSETQSASQVRRVKRSKPGSYELKMLA